VSEQMSVFAGKLPEAVRELEDLLTAEDSG
jgi:hypothetical protein